MGCGTSALKKEIATLQSLDAERTAEIGKLEDERRMLKYKMSMLEEMVATAQLEAHEKMTLAEQTEERMKVMKWEMVRQAKPSTPRQTLTWELNEQTIQKLVKSPTTRRESETIQTKNSEIDKNPSSSTPSKVVAHTTAPAISSNDTISTIDKRPSMKPELSRANTPMNIDITSKNNAEVESFQSTSVNPSTRRTKDINSIERGDATSMRRNSSKTMSSARRATKNEDELVVDLTSPKDQPSIQPLTTDQPKTISKHSPTSASKSGIIVNSRESSPTAKSGDFVLAMPLSRGNDLAPRKYSKETSPPRPEKKNLQKKPSISADEPDSEEEPGDVKPFSDDDILDGSDTELQTKRK